MTAVDGGSSDHNLLRDKGEENANGDTGHIQTTDGGTVGGFGGAGTLGNFVDVVKAAQAHENGEELKRQDSILISRSALQEELKKIREIANDTAQHYNTKHHQNQ